MGLKRVSWVRRYQGQCRALRPLGHQGCRLRNYTKDPPLCSGYSGSAGQDRANAMIRHWLTIFDVPAVICSDRGSQFVGTWFKTMCKHMGIRHAKTVAYT